MTITESGIQIPDIRDEISRARRHPGHCLYGPEPADSDEHVLSAALGGRLAAPILCAHHNGLVADTADAKLAKQFSPLATMLRIPRPGRGVASFEGRTDSGERVRIDANGKVQRKKIDVARTGATGKLNYVKGELAKLDQLKAEGHIEDSSRLLIMTLEKPPIVNFEIAVARDVEPGILKVALHFIAGFVVDVDIDVAAELLPYIRGDKVAGGLYVRTLPLSGEFFPESWPPRHEIRTYPAASETFITVLLFGLYGFNVRVPILTNRSVRYFQPILETYAPILEDNGHVRTFDWDDRLDAQSWPETHQNQKFRHEKFFGYARWCEQVDQCKSAALRAASARFSYSGLSFIDAYRAELQKEALSAEDVVLLVSFARAAVQKNIPVWQLPLEQFFT